MAPPWDSSNSTAHGGAPDGSYVASNVSYDPSYASFSGHDASYTNDDTYVSEDASAPASIPEKDEYAAAYWRLDAEAREVMLALSPERLGDSTPLGDLAELCCRMGRPVRDEAEQRRLLKALDSANQMQISRHDLVTWLLTDMLAERDSSSTSQPQAAVEYPPAQPAWEEVVDLEPSQGVGMPPTASPYYYNTLTGESSWTLPRFIQSLRAFFADQATKRALRVALPADGTPVFLLQSSTQDATAQYKHVSDLEELRGLFDRCDDDDSGALDAAEFQDLCVAVGQPLNGPEGVAALMLEVDPLSGSQGVSWVALSRYWLSNSPFQRRTRLDPPGATFEAWELVEAVQQSEKAPVYRHTVTLRERWNHPDIEQRVADMLTTLFPSSKLDWAKKIELFLDVQWQMQVRQDDQRQPVDANTPPSDRNWDLRTCCRVLTQLQHPMTRRSHVEAAVQQLNDRFSLGTSVSDHPLTVEESAVRDWLLYCVKMADQRGWEQIVDADSGQVYYHHETSGTTQWDPPNLAGQMADMLGLSSSSSVGGTDAKGKKLTPTERIARLFRQYDTDESGAITLDEFRPFYRALVGRGGSNSTVNDESVSESQLQHLFSVLDASGDGEVTLEEFQLWWLTKLELEEDETEAIKLEKKRTQQRELCRSYLENAGAAVVLDRAGEVSEPPTEPTTPRIGFESNILPRLVTLLGPFQLKGLAHRSALSELVSGLDQQVDLVEFLDWYGRFEVAEMDRRALEDAKAKARAELVAQQQKELAAAKEKRRKMKQKRQLAAPTATAGGQDAAALREQKITALFKAFDANGSGFLDDKELQQLTKALGHDMTNEQLGDMMRIIDVSGDGQVSLSEFVTFWNAFQPAHGVESPHAKVKQRGGAITTATVTPANSQPASRQQRPSATFTDMNASLEVALELAKQRALKISLGDFKDVLGEWKADFQARGKHKAEALLRLEQQRQEQLNQEELRRQRWAFKPTRSRKYGAFRLDVSWIEPEVVECVSDMTRSIRAQIRPQLAPDAAQTIQTLARGYITRVRVFKMIKTRFAVYVDANTQFYYYVDTLTLNMHLERPVYRRRLSSVKPFDLEDCESKVTAHHFRKKMAEMQRKAAFYDRNFRSRGIDQQQQSSPSLKPPYRLLLAPSAMFLFDVAESVHKRLLSNIWLALRDNEHELVELIACRHPRQLRQRSSDSARNLPLHYMLRHGDRFPLRTIRAVVCGFQDALLKADAFGMTPLHVALREWRRCRSDRLALLELLVPRRQQSTDDRGQTRSIWEARTLCGDTPLHVAVRYRASISAMRWVLESCQHGEDRAPETLTVKNKHGESAFHASVVQYADAEDPAYAKTVILLILKHSNPSALCGYPTRRGDLPLHLTLDAIERRKQSKTQTTTGTLLSVHQGEDLSSSDASAECWLIRELVRHCPMALAVSKSSNGLLPIHLAVKYGLPSALLCELIDETTRQLRQYIPVKTSAQKSSAVSHGQEQTSLLQATTISATNTTLVHYTLMHQPHAIEFVFKLIDLMPAACSVHTTPGNELPIHIAAGIHLQSKTPSSTSDDGDADSHARLVQRLCNLHPPGCEAYNTARELPLHVAIKRGNSLRAVQILLELSSSALGGDKERRGLRALVMAASARVPDYRVLLALLEVTPCRSRTSELTTTSKTQRSSNNTLVTPLYALSMRQCSPEIIENRIPHSFFDKYERIEDEDAYFLEMAKQKLRHRHHCPSESWTFERILTLMEHNPLDEAVMQRALYAINAKLLAILNTTKAKAWSPSGSPSDGDAVILETVTLNPDLQLVRTVHQTLYESPGNPRLQIIGKSVLDKLLPTAYAKAAYKSKIDPYFNL